MDLQIPFDPSPHFTKGGNSCQYIVLHSMAGFFTGTRSWFKNPKSKVSAHYLVSQKGELLQMVQDFDRAWHCYGVNSKSIGVEMEDCAEKDISWLTPELWSSAVDLCAHLCKKHNIDPTTHIVRHSEKWIQDIGRAKGFAHNDPQTFGEEILNNFRVQVKEKINGLS